LRIIDLLTPADKALVAFIIILSLATLPLIFKTKGEEVIIEVNGKPLYRLSLSQPRTVEVYGPIGRTVVKIEGGKAWVASSDCPHKLCVKRGKISHSGEMVICVPNKVVVRIVGRRGGQYDAITW